MTRQRLFLLMSVFLSSLLACNLIGDAEPTAVTEPKASAQPAPTQAVAVPASPPPRTAADWLANPVRGTVIEIGYGGPDEYNDPPYPTVASLKQLRALGVQVVTLEFQYAWTIEPPYQADETQFALVTDALDNIGESGLTAVIAVRNGPGRNAMMPSIADEDVITTLYEDEAALIAYQEMLRDVTGRFRDRPEIIAWEPIIEPTIDWFLTGEEEPPYPQAAALWNSLAPQLIAAIRDVDSERPILIEPVNWGGADGFILLDRFDDDNLIYSLHTYEPFDFTHQETPPYNAYPGRFDGEQFDREALAVLLEPVIAFQEEHDVPIVVGEWGGIRWLPGIDQYITDQLSLFEAYGWSWFWYAWDDEEWDELGFELHMGPSRESPRYDPTTAAFAPLVAAWQSARPAESPPPLSNAFETRADGAIRLTDPPADASDQNAAFAPDGGRLLFTRFENGYNIGPAGLLLLDFTSGQITRLTPEEDQDNVNLPGSAWNAFNDRIVFASDRGESDDLWRVAPDGTDFNPITAHDGPPWYIEPSWSPDGRWVVFEADNNVPDDRQQGSIWKVRADGSDLTPLSDGPANGVDDRQPNWSPAGDRILFQRHIPGSEDWNLYTMASDGKDVRQVTLTPASDTDASWSPDGRFIVYSSDHGDLPTPNLFIISAAGGDPIRVTFSDINEDGAPSWSPDGRYIAFESHEGQDEDSPSMLWYITVPDLVGETAVTSDAADDNLWRPALNTTWQWQLSPPLDSSFDVDMYDIELFDNDASVVAALHAQGRKVVCYISVGSWEDWRPDQDHFPATVVGNDYEGWPGEKWLDIRQIELLAPIMRARLDTCQANGFDGIEPDNIDSYTNETGFPLTYQDQLNYNIWLAEEAHARGLSIGLKNDGEQAIDLQPHFDWVLTEDCFDQGWCEEMLPFISAGKAVFAAEYTDTGITLEEFCPQARAMNISAILKNRDLDAWQEACPPLPSPSSESGTDETSTAALSALPSLSDVNQWLYLIDVNVEAETIAQIAASTYDMVVLDFIPSEENNTDYPMAQVIDQLHNALQPKLAIAYIDIGQAEDFRTYWQSGWGIGDPEWIITGDPDGWEGNFPVAYWYDEYRDIWLGEDGYLQAILEAGFDGVYLDWVEAYSDEDAAAFAIEDGADARQEMIWWVADIGEFGRSRNPDFIVISQNAAELAQSNEFVETIDAISQEQVWFDGGADSDPPGDCPLPRSDDAIDSGAYYDSLSSACRGQYDDFPESTLHMSSEEYLRDLKVAQSRGLIIFTVDYALKEDHIAWVYGTSRGLGFVPFVGSRALDHFIEPFP